MFERTFRNTFLHIFSLKLYVGLGGFEKEHDPWTPVEVSQTNGCTSVATTKDGSLYDVKV